MNQQARLIELVASALDLPVSSVSLDSTVDSLEGWDSLAHLRILMQVERAFGVRVDMEAAAELASVREILDYLRAAG